MFFKKKKRDQEIQAMKEDIDARMDKAIRRVVKNRRTLQNKEITFEIKRALGGHHV